MPIRDMADLCSQCYKIINSLWHRVKRTRYASIVMYYYTHLEIFANQRLIFYRDGKENTVKKLNAAISRYASACASFKAASTPLRSLQFACDYSKLRCEFLQALVQLLHCCRSLCTAPPYAIAAHEAHTAKDELQRYGRVTSQVFTFN